MDDLIKIFQYSSVYRKGKVNSFICTILLNRASDIKYREIRSLLRILSKVRFPLGKEADIFEEIVKFINENFDTIEMTFKIDIYKNVSQLNPLIWNTGGLFKKLEKDILDNFEMLEYSHIKNLLRLKSKENKFVPLVFRKTLELVNNNG